MGEQSKPAAGGLKAMILVAGMHRSGTSALALAGCDLPKTLVGPQPDNVTGFWESQALSDLNEEILVSSGSSHLDWRPFDRGWYGSPAAAGFRARAQETLQQEFGDSRLFVLKDPRTCRLLEFWIDDAAAFGAPPLVVSPIRNPLDVAASLHKRNQLDPFVAYLAWLRHVLDAEAGSRGVPRSYVRYEQLLSDAHACVDRIGRDLGVAWPRRSSPEMKSDIDAFLAPDLRHHRSGDERLLSNPRIPPWVRATFSIVDRWTQGAEDEAHRPELDRIGTALDDAAPAFSRALAASRREMYRQMAERDAARRDVAERDQRIAALEAERDTSPWRRHAASRSRRPARKPSREPSSLAMRSRSSPISRSTASKRSFIAFDVASKRSFIAFDVAPRRSCNFTMSLRSHAKSPITRAGVIRSAISGIVLTLTCRQATVHAASRSRRPARKPSREPSSLAMRSRSSPISRSTASKRSFIAFDVASKRSFIAFDVASKRSFIAFDVASRRSCNFTMSLRSHAKSPITRAGVIRSAISGIVLTLACREATAPASALNHS